MLASPHSVETLCGNFGRFKHEPEIIAINQVTLERKSIYEYLQYKRSL